MSERILRSVISVVAMLVTLGSVAVPTPAFAQSPGSVDPADTRLVPSPGPNSDPGTAWECRSSGQEVRCAGTVTFQWQEQDGPEDWCSTPILSVNGTFVRTQTRYYGYDDPTGSFLEYKRLIHVSSEESLVPASEPAASSVRAWLNMTWQTSFQVPGDLDSRVTRKQGIDTLIKPLAGGPILLDVGQKTEDRMTAPGEDFDFRGRWDIALGDPAVEFGKVCTALGL